MVCFGALVVWVVAGDLLWLFSGCGCCRVGFLFTGFSGFGVFIVVVIWCLCLVCLGLLLVAFQPFCFCMDVIM